MPNIKSQKKRVLTNEKQNVINTAKRSKVRNAIKKYRAAIAAADIETAEKLLPETISVIDCAAKDGVYHKQNASRKISRLSKALDKLKKKKKKK